MSPNPTNPPKHHPKRKKGFTGLLSAHAVIWALWGAVLCVFTWRMYFKQGHLIDARFSRALRPPLTDRLVIVLADSVPFSMAFDPQYYPFLSAQRHRGSWGLLWTEEPTMTGLMVDATVTGNRPFMWTTLRNWKMQLLPHETFLDGLRQMGLRIDGWGDAPWGEQLGDRLRRHYVLAEEGKTAAGKPIHWRENKLLDMAARIIDVGLWAVREDHFDVLIWHLACTDQIMHFAYRDSAETRWVLRYTDGLFQRLVDRLDDGHTTFLFFSDHGCAANGRHGTLDAEAKQAYYLLFGPGVAAAGRHDILQIDLASTLLALFGRSPNAPSAGRPLVEALDVRPATRAAFMLAAAESRLDYLQLKKTREPRDTPDAALLRAQKTLNQARAAARSHHHAKTITLADAMLRRLHHAAVAARRTNGWLEPVLWWLALGLVLIALFAGLVLTDGRTGTGSPPAAVIGSTWAMFPPLAAALVWDRRYLWPPLIALAAILHLGRLWPRVWRGRRTTRFLALGVPALMIYLVGVTLLHIWTGIICNTLLFEITESAETVFVSAVQLSVLLGLLVLFLSRRPIRASLERAPFAWSAIGCVLLAGANGYYAGFYFPFLLGLFVLLLWRGLPQRFAPRGRLARWASALLPLAACAFIFRWQITWDRHFYFLRYWMEAHPQIGGVAAGVAFLALAAVVWWQFPYPENMRSVGHTHPSPCPRKRPAATGWFLLAAFYLAAVVGGRHILFPSPAENVCRSLGHYLLAARSTQLRAAVACLPVLLIGWRNPGLSSTLITLTLAAVTAVTGSPFESPLFLGVLLLFYPLSAHPVFATFRSDTPSTPPAAEGPTALWRAHPLAIPAAAFCLIAGRVLFHVVFDFKLNFTTVHDLLRFAPTLDWSEWRFMLPSIALRHLPPMALLVWLFLRRLDTRTALQAGLLALFYLAARTLYIVILAHLTRRQLYLNWRNLGEAVYYGFWAAALIISLFYLLAVRRPFRTSSNRGPSSHSA
jgi:hypothetical protein